MALDISNCFRENDDVSIRRGVLCTTYLALENLTTTSNISSAATTSNRYMLGNGGALSTLLSISRLEAVGYDDGMNEMTEYRKSGLEEEDSQVQELVSGVISWSLDTLDNETDSLSRSMKGAILTLMKEKLIS